MKHEYFYLGNFISPYLCGDTTNPLRPAGERSEVGTYTAPYSMVSGAWSENFSSL
jgi:hypothetical protein